MSQPTAPRALSRTETSEAVADVGWRLILGRLEALVPVASTRDALAVADLVTTTLGQLADEHLFLNVRPHVVALSLATRSTGAVTDRDVALARVASEALTAAGYALAPPTSAHVPRPVQILEICIDAIDIAAIRPFWKAVLGYAEFVGDNNTLLDPTDAMPAIWFQQMDVARPQRNRIHFDIAVAHDEAEARVNAALAAGGHMVNDSFARAFWVLADAEGNEVCVCTWLDRDERGW